MINKTLFEKKRYIILRNYFSYESLLKETNKVIDQAHLNKWKFIKVYFNGFFRKNLNIFAISYPLNNFFKSNLQNELYNVDYKKIILKLTKWIDLRTTSIEIQHNQKYNYQSTWHRDVSHFPSNSLNIVIYLKDEVGLRIVPNENNAKLEKFISNPKKKINYLKIPPNYYDIIDVKAGDILIMDSGLLHQGFAKGNRTHIFIGCEEKNTQTISKKSFVNDYGLNKQLDPNLNYDELQKFSQNDSYNFDVNYYSLKNKIKSIFYTFLYFVPLKSIFNHLKDFKKKKTHFHYTFFQ